MNITDLLLLLTGFAGLILGGNLLVQGAVSIATRYDISPMIIGLTLVGFGTSIPELLTSVQAAFDGSPGIAVGNVVGSNIANILLIIGVSASLSPITVHPSALKRDGAVLIAATLLCLGIVLYGAITVTTGLVLVTALIIYVAGTIFMERRSQSAAKALYEHEAETLPAKEQSAWRAGITMIIGLGVTIVSARLLVSNAISIATGLGVSEALIGLTIVAVGTSLPELITSVIAARKGQSDVALGNVIGSNIFNILGILGVTSLLRPIEIPAVIASLDIWVMTAATVLLIVFAWTGQRINRREGFLMISGYTAYLVWLGINQ